MIDMTDMVEGRLYSDGRGGIRKLLSISSPNGKLSRKSTVTYELTAKTANVGSNQANVGDTCTCSLEHFRRWAREARK